MSERICAKCNATIAFDADETGFGPIHKTDGQCFAALHDELSTIRARLASVKAERDEARTRLAAAEGFLAEVLPYIPRCARESCAGEQCALRDRVAAHIGGKS